MTTLFCTVAPIVTIALLVAVVWGGVIHDQEEQERRA